MRWRAEEASLRMPRGPADNLGHVGERVAEDVVQDECDALGRGHRVEHDQERHADRLIEGDPVGRVALRPREA